MTYLWEAQFINRVIQRLCVGKLNYLFNQATVFAGYGAIRYPLTNKEIAMSLGTILLIIFILLLIGALPTWGHSRAWGYGPSGGVGLIVLVLLILVLMGKI